MPDASPALQKSRRRAPWDAVPHIEYFNGASERQGLCWDLGPQTQVTPLTWQLRVHLSLEASSLVHMFHSVLPASWPHS